MDPSTALACAASTAAIGLSGLGYGTLLPRTTPRAGLETPWAIGLGTLSGVVLTLGLARALSRATVAGAVAAGMALLLVPRLRARLRQDARPARATVLVLLLFAPSLALSFVPPTFFDPLMYNVTLPDLYLREHAVAVHRETILSFYPQCAEMLFLASLALTKLPEAAAGVHVLLGALATLATASLAGRLAGDSARPIAALLFASAPSVLVLALLAKNDLAVVLFVTIAFASAVDLLDRGAPPVAGALALGFALACKYTALLAGASLVLPLAAVVALRGPRLRAGTLALLAILALLPALPWYARSWMASGNPFYPTLTGIFGYAPFQRIGFLNPVERRVLPFARLLTVPLHVSLGWSGFGDFSDAGPLFLVLVPLALLLRAPVRHLGLCAAFALLDLLLWWRTFNVARFLWPLLPPAAAVAAAGLLALRARLPRLAPLLAAVIALAVAGNLARFGLQAADLLDPLPYLLGRETRDGYLARLYPPYDAVHAAGRLLPADARVLFVGETRGLYMDRPYVANSANDRTVIVDYVRRARDLPDLLRRLRADGFTHVLYNPIELERLRRHFGEYLDLAGGRERALYQAFVDTILAHPVFASHGVWLCAIPAPPA